MGTKKGILFFSHLRFCKKKVSQGAIFYGMDINYNDNMNKVTMQLNSKKSQEELIQQNFLELSVLSTLNAL